eukprot:485305_1
MAASFLLIVHSFICVVNSMGWSNIWTDDCDTQVSWACHLPPVDGIDGVCQFGYNSNQCQDNNCHRVCRNAYIQNSVPVSSYAAYAGRPLRLSFYVHLESGELPNDRCRMRFAYDNEDYDIDNYDWQCGSP